MSAIGHQSVPRNLVKLRERNQGLLHSTLVLPLGCLTAVAMFYSAWAAAEPWVWQNPQPTGNHLYSGAIPSQQTLVAVGMSGTVVRSTDAGLTWTVLKLGEQDVVAVAFADSDTGIAVGQQGSILRTTDGGISWGAESSGTNLTLYAASSAGQSSFVAVGQQGIILRSDDGGLSWISLPSGTERTLHGVSFVSSYTGTVVGDRTILRTEDGGSTWVSQFSETETMHPYFWQVAFAEESVGIAVGENSFPFPNRPFVLHTSDGGMNWQVPSTYFGVSGAMTGVAVFDPQRMVAVNNYVWRSDDSGDTWTRSHDESLSHSIATSNNGSALMVGFSGRMFYSTDEARSWTPLRRSWLEPSSAFPNRSFRSVAFVDSSTGTAVGDWGAILRTEDGGATWEQQFGTTSILYGIAALDANNAIAVGSTADLIVQTNDGGQTWQTRLQGAVGAGLQSVAYLGLDEAIAVGGAGKIYKSRDAGETWTRIPPPPCCTNAEFWSVAAIADTVMIAGYPSVLAGTLLKSVDQGETWQELPNDSTQSLYGVAMVDENIATAVGELGTILRTIDGGMSWTQQPTGYQTALRAVSFAGNTGYIVGYSGVILRSDDAGASWIEQPFTHIRLLGVQVMDENTTVIVGEGEAILRTETGGR